MAPISSSEKSKGRLGRTGRRRKGKRKEGKRERHGGRCVGLLILRREKPLAISGGEEGILPFMGSSCLQGVRKVLSAPALSRREGGEGIES